MPKKVKGTKIKLEFVIPDESPQREIIARKFTELMEVATADDSHTKRIRND